MKRICIYGAGAIGGFLGARLARTECDLSLVARGPHLAAIQADGLTLVETDADGEKRSVHAIRATENPAELGPQDYVIITLKAHSIPAIIERTKPLLGPETAVVFAVNGVPWWYFADLDGPFRDRRIESVDPGGTIWEGIGPERAIGCVVYPAAEISEPGVISHLNGDRFTLGEPSGERTPRAQWLSRLMISAGLKAPVRPRIRDEIWIKLWGNSSFNPVSALTGGTLAEIARDPETRAVITSIMTEVQDVAEALGAHMAIGIEKRIEGAASVGEHRTSMLQDLDMGRPMEIDALVGAVQELARLAGIPTPTLDAVLALIKQRARLSGCYQG